MPFIPKMLQKVDVASVIDSIPAAVIVLDHQTRIMLANRMACRITGRGKESFCGLSWGEAFRCVRQNGNPRGCGFGDSCGLCGVRRVVEETLADGQDRCMVEAELELTGLGKRNVRLTTTYLVPDRAVILLIEDVTDCKRWEQEHLDRNRLQTAVETAGAVCHEMNQPLQAVSGYLELILMQLEEDHPCRRYLPEVQHQVQRLGRITGRLQSLSHYRTREYLSGVRILDLECSSDN